MSGFVGRFFGCDCCVIMRFFLFDILILEGVILLLVDMDDCFAGGVGVLVFLVGFGLECFCKNEFV